MKRPRDKSCCLVCADSPIENSGSISWIRCDICRQWLHTQCVSLKDTETGKIASYHCIDCEEDHGPSQMKRTLKRARVKIDYVALDQGDTFAVDKSVHPHVLSFLLFDVEADRSKNGFIDVLEPAELTKLFVLDTQLQKPVLILDVDSGGLGMQLPRARDEILVEYIAQKTGGDHRVEVMDVLLQQSESPLWNLDQWRKYFYTAANDRDRIRNVISLEVSDVEDLGTEFVRPEMVRKLDLVDKVWCDSDGNDQKRPKVTVYCLMSVAGSYTDFHIDFSGTPVYYTVCSGTKTFLMYPPTDENLQLYKLWCQEPQQNFIWFGEYTRKVFGKKLKAQSGFKVDLQKGDLFFIPSGWIHSVYTPEDAIIIGGNYLTLRDLPMHLKIYGIEKETKVPSKYRFPMFNKVLWLTLWYYYNHQDEFLHDTGGKLKGEEGEESREVKREEEEEEEEKGENLRRTVLDLLIQHLRDHYETSKLKPVAKKSIPTALIGKNVVAYLEKLEKWKQSY